MTQTETRIFHYDFLGHIIAETNQSGQMLAEYIYLGDQLLSMIKPGELAYYFHSDHLGTPQVLTNDSQAIAWKAAYTPFGEAVVLIAAVENPFRLPGQYYDQETGLHYNYFRYYNPPIGRYVTPDPIGLDGGINLYPYSVNDPINRVDPLGLANKLPPVIRKPVPDKPPIIKNPLPIFEPRKDPIPPGWSPPFPRNLCEMGCYLSLFMDFYVCNMKWSMEHLEDPQTTCPETQKQHNEECKRDAYNHYMRCISNCPK